ncbi:MAG: ATP-binding protein [Bacteroidota bacterium]
MTWVLVAALEWYTEEFNHRYSIEVDFRSDQEEYTLPAPVVTNLFRIYQESLTNVARHAKATNVKAELWLSEGSICLSVKDNGEGFSGGKNGKKTLGLTGMKERALMIGGRLDIKSSPGEGATVSIVVPLYDNSHQTLSNFHVNDMLPATKRGT